LIHFRSTNTGVVCLNSRKSVFASVAILVSYMNASAIIRDSVARVTALREVTSRQAALSEATKAIKNFQSRRFAGT
jgi:hypothetical protein